MEYAEALIATVAVFLFAYYYMSNTKKRPPGPIGIPILGYLPFLGSHPAKKYCELSKKYGPVLSLKLGPETFTVLNDYQTIQEALVRNGQVFSGRLQNGFIKAYYPGGYGISVHPYDESLKAHRKFFLKTLRGFGVDKKGMEKQVMEELEFFLTEIALTQEKPTNCRMLLARAVSNVISNVILGSRYSYEDKEFQEVVEVINQDFTSNTVNALCFSLMLVAPALRLIPPFSTVLKVLVDGKNRVKAMHRKSVAEHREDLEKGHPRDFLDEYLLMMETEDGESLSFCEEQLYEELSDLFMAGTETTASAVSWGLLLFAHRPDIQNKLHKEVVEIIGDGMPSMKHKSAMPYLNAFILELMRHRTLAPLALPHTTTENICFKGYNIPKGATVLPNIWAVHHDPEYFKNPGEFNPDRFIDGEGNLINDPRVMPFSLGPRYCLGEQLAKVELFLFLSSIIQRFEVQGDRSTLPSFHEGVVGIAYVPKYFEVSFISRDGQ